jgi:L-alanine-DL-glutamate epimerase-like enolase superfamily enzyme
VKIKRIEPIAVAFPMKKPVYMAGVEIKQADNLLIRIEADNGAVGWGEAAEAPTMTGETVEGMFAAASYILPALIGRDAEDIEGATRAMTGRMYGNNAAKAAIEIALHDLVGRATNRPVHALLGGKKRDRIALLGVISNGKLAGDLEDAAKKKAEGYRAFKIKVGIETPALDAERTRQVCKLLGPDLLLCTDANMGWNREDALQYTRAVTGSGLAFFEQPVHADDIASMAAISAAATDFAIGADESIHSMEDIRRHHEHKAARGVSLKTIKLGGMRNVMNAGILCDQLGMSVNVSCKTGESSLAGAAGLHIAAALPQINWGLTLSHQGLSDDITANPIRIEQGHVTVSDRPGLGIDVDEDRVRRYRRDVTARKVA